MEFKKLSAVDSVNKPSEEAHILIEEDGVIKKAPKSAVGGGSTRKKELVYEWNPGIDADGNPVTDVSELFINVDDDLSWMTRYNSDINFEVEAYLYGCKCETITNDDGSTYNELVVNPAFEAVLITNGKNSYCTERRKNDKDELCYVYADGSDWVTPSYGPLDCAYFDMGIYNNKHIDEDWNYNDVEIGGSFEIYASEYYPLKSIKIYKITY